MRNECYVLMVEEFPIVPGFLHFKPYFSSTTCQCWVLTHLHFNIVSGLHPYVMIMAELAWWVLVGKNIIARMASNDLTTQK